MFTQPIQHVLLTSIDELISFSFRTTEKANPLTFCLNNGQIAFTDKYGDMYVTPYRSEILVLLSSADYHQDNYSVPFSNGETRPPVYNWLQKIADEENWAETYKMAFEYSREKKILQINLPNPKIHVKEIKDSYEDVDNDVVYRAMINVFLSNNTCINLGTYIVLDDKSIMVCDEYGRTYLIRTNTVINDIVNILIDANYTRTQHPEWYVETKSALPG